MIGDGYTSVMHCENADEADYEFHEPDAEPVLCDFTHSLKTAADAFRKLGNAAAKVEFPDFAEIKRMRLQDLKKQHGLYRFITLDYYQWRF